eukprot:15469084-Alexandrium_andersonii.AAC.2
MSANVDSKQTCIGLGYRILVLTSAPSNMHHRFGRSEFELRGPTNGLNTSTFRGLVQGVRRHFAH